MRGARILQVIDTLNVGGAERVFVDLTNLLHEAGVAVAALFLLEAGALAKDLHPAIERIELNRKAKFELKSLRRVARIINEFRIVHCHSRHIYRYVKLAQRLFAVETEVILHDHGLLRVNQKVPFLLNGFLKPNYYVGVSQELNDWASRKLSLERERMFLLENIVRKQIAPAVVAEKNGVVLASNIKPVKNQRFVLDAFKKLDSPLTIIGGVQDVDYYSQLQTAATLVPNVRILTDVSNLQPELPVFKLGLHASKSETGPLVLIEYLAQGLPFLAFDTGAVAQILKPHFPQYFIDNFEVGEWIERIEFLLGEEPDARKMERVFEQHFGSGQYIEKCLKIYQNISN